jgi:hypothetical protein
MSAVRGEARPIRGVEEGGDGEEGGVWVLETGGGFEAGEGRGRMTMKVLPGRPPGR